MRSNELSTIALSITVFTLIAVTPAVARIECRDNFQVTKHGLIPALLRGEANCTRSPILRFRRVRRRGSQQSQHEGLYIRLKGSCGAYSEPRGFPW